MASRALARSLIPGKRTHRSDQLCPGSSRLVQRSLKETGLRRQKGRDLNRKAKNCLR